MTGLKEWLDQEVQRKVLPRSPISEAIGYAQNHRNAPERYLEVGCLEIDNRASVWAMMPVAIGCKKWLLAGINAGAGRR